MTETFTRLRPLILILLQCMHTHTHTSLCIIHQLAFFFLRDKLKQTSLHLNIFHLPPTSNSAIQEEDFGLLVLLLLLLCSLSNLGGAHCGHVHLSSSPLHPRVLAMCCSRLLFIKAEQHTLPHQWWWWWFFLVRFHGPRNFSCLFIPFDLHDLSVCLVRFSSCCVCTCIGSSRMPLYVIFCLCVCVCAQQRDNVG